MKNKIISGIIGAILGGLIVFGYGYFTQGNTTNNLEKANTPQKEMGDEQIQRIAERSGLSESEIKARMEAGESGRDIMGESMGGTKGGDGTGFKNNN